MPLNVAEYGHKGAIMETMVHTVATQVEALHSARKAYVAVKTVKADMPRRNDVWGMQDELGEFIETGKVRANTVGTLVSVMYDRTGRTGMLSLNGFTRVGSREWIVR